MSHIVAHQHQNSNSLIPSAHPGKDFLFCADGSDLSRRIQKARQNLVLDDSPRRNASFTSSIVALLRKQHRHKASCAACLVREALAGSLLQ
jgi:hypothetical protein